MFHDLIILMFYCETILFFLRLVPVKSQQTAQLCGFVLHDNAKCLQQFPFNMSLVEYGFQANYQFETYCKQYSDNGYIIFSYLQYCI